MARVLPYATVRLLEEAGSKPVGVKAETPPASATARSEEIVYILKFVNMKIGIFD
jgi:hypothetical protein